MREYLDRLGRAQTTPIYIYFDEMKAREGLHSFIHASRDLETRPISSPPEKQEEWYYSYEVWRSGVYDVEVCLERVPVMVQVAGD